MSTCRKNFRKCKGDVSLALVGECNGFKCQDIKKRYEAALAECEQGNCSGFRGVVAHNNKEIRLYAINNILNIQEKQLIAQMLKETGNLRFSLEVSRNISNALSLIKLEEVKVLENSLRFQVGILRAMNKFNEANFAISTADHIKSLHDKIERIT